MKVKSIFDRYKTQIQGDAVFDAIRQKYVHLTPEEIVRQKTVKFLMKRLGVPRNRIIVERSLSSLGIEGSRRRIDIGIFDDAARLMAVVECKASLSRGDEAAFIQAQNYFQELHARYFFVTDGCTFSGYYFDTLQFIRLEEIPRYEEWRHYPTAREP